MFVSKTAPRLPTSSLRTGTITPFTIILGIEIFARICGITDGLLCRLQKVQNNAPRVVSGSKKHDHIAPVLRELHWLPIRKMIEFMILLLTSTPLE